MFLNGGDRRTEYLLRLYNNSNSDAFVSNHKVLNNTSYVAIYGTYLTGLIYDSSNDEQSMIKRKIKNSWIAARTTSCVTLLIVALLQNVLIRLTAQSLMRFVWLLFLFSEVSRYLRWFSLT